MSNQEENRPHLETDKTIIGGEESGTETVTRRTPFEAIRESLRERRFLVITVAVVALTTFVIVFVWLRRSSEEGRIVPAPRNTSFAEANTTTGTVDEVLTLAPEQVERAGLKIETVGETLSSEAVNVSSTGVVQPNAYRETPVLSLVGGVVRRVNVVLGERTGQGSTVAVVFSDELAAAQSRYLALQTEAQTARQNYDREARLVKISPASSAELDAALAKLKTAQAELEEHHKHHMRTMKLVEIGAASREEFEMATTKLATAEADVEEAQKRYDRAVQVAQINPVSRSEFEQAAVKLRTAESDLAASRQRLILLGLSSQRVESLHSPSQITSEVAVSSPASGTVTSRSVNPGEIIEANKELARVTNLSTVWVMAEVYEKDLATIRVGSGASVTSDAYPNRLFRGHVGYIDPNIKPETRTAQVRVELENPGQALKIGMYVNVAFGSTGAAERTLPVIPRSAVQNINNQQIVFVVTDDPNNFIIRHVRLGSEANGQYAVLEGLNVGDRIVNDGSFLLRAEWLKQRPPNN